MTNLVEYLINGSTVLDARTKEVKLRMLDRVRAEKERFFWQFFNIGLPIIALLVFGLIFHFWRSRKYVN
jgi:hypothetical protein